MVVLNDYDENWPKLFEQVKESILKSTGEWIEAVEHVGSTSIPYLSAKPTIDICIGVSSLKKANHIIKALQQLGYDYLAHLEKDIPERRYLQKLNEAGDHLIHIHIVLFNNRLWKEYIEFRDYLIAHPDEARHYEKLKKGLKEKFSHDRLAYTKGKAAYIQNILSHVREAKFV